MNDEGDLPGVSVGELAALARGGDLGRRHFSLLRGVEGIRAHQRVQRGRGEGYEAEVSLRAVWGGRLELQGRVDGVWRREGELILEEIKTTREAGEELPHDFDAHRMQALLYAWMWRETRGELPRVRLVYVSPEEDSERVMEVEVGNLDEEVGRVCGEWLEVWEARRAWEAVRDVSLRELVFPHAETRAGQEEMMVEVERSLRQGGRLYVQAPTGIGKTLALLVPSLRAMGEGHIRRLFVATCRNSGKTVYTDTLRRLVDRGVRLRALVLVAKERTCKRMGSPCDCAACPLAIGFFGRLREGLVALRREPFWDAATWRRVAEAHGLCPHGFLLHALREADVVVGDLNSALDPGARLEQWFGEEPEATALLIDEAHHVPERCREMLSARLDPKSLSPVWPPELRGLATLLSPVKTRLRAYRRDALDGEGMPVEEQAAPVALGEACRRAAEGLEQSYGSLVPVEGDPREGLIRELRGVAASVERRMEAQVFFEEGGCLRSFCRDVAEWLSDRLAPLRAVVFCSATLGPLPVFRRLTGARAEDRELVLESPFDPARFPVELERGIPVVWRSRDAEMYGWLAERVQRFLAENPGKTLVFLPSFEMLEELKKRLPAEDLWMGPVLAQPRGLQEEGSEVFLRPFRGGSGPVTGLAVLGGALNEGVDLPGDALTGVVVVSIGLPAVTRERELLRDWHQRRDGDGFVMAYTVPGLLRVLQAMGRVIRGPEDRGRALLIDPRFDHPFYDPFLGEHRRVMREG